MQIVYDEIKRQTNLAKHGFDFAELTVEFFDNATVVETSESRLGAIGAWGEVTIFVVFRFLGDEALSVISMRPANRKERKLL